MARLLIAAVLCFLATASAFAPPMGAAVTRSAVRPAAASVVMGGAATKATRVNMRNRAYNKKYKSEMRTMIKKVGVALQTVLPDTPRPRPRALSSHDARCHTTAGCEAPPCGIAASAAAVASCAVVLARTLRKERVLLAAKCRFNFLSL